MRVRGNSGTIHAVAAATAATATAITTDAAAAAAEEENAVYAAPIAAVVAAAIVVQWYSAAGQPSVRCGGRRRAATRADANANQSPLNGPVVDADERT